jgi:hypothetical protein
MSTASHLPGWPASTPRPHRLDQLLGFLSKKTSADFAGFHVYDLLSAPLIELNPGREEIVRPFSPVFGFFAGDGSGGQLAIWLRSSNAAECPVILFDSEGRRDVLGENLDDFLCLLAGQWESDQYEELQGDEEFRDWVREIGLRPHARCEERFEPLNLATLAFHRWFAGEQRGVESRLFPERSLDIDIDPGRRVDVVSIGESESDVSGRLGTPHYASWEKPSDPQLTARYDRVPYTVVFERSSSQVEEIRIFADVAVVRLPGDFEPLYATRAAVFRWLADRDANAIEDRGTIISSVLGLSMQLGKGYGYSDLPLTRWVTAIKVRKRS